VHLGKRSEGSFRPRHEAEGDHEAEGPIPEGQRLYVTDARTNPIRVGRLICHPAGIHQHCGRDVHGRDPSPSPSQLDRRNARPAAGVEHRLARLEPEGIDPLQRESQAILLNDADRIASIVDLPPRQRLLLLGRQGRPWSFLRRLRVGRGHDRAAGVFIVQG
jgi:hypothetical protein